MKKRNYIFKGQISVAWSSIFNGVYVCSSPRSSCDPLCGAFRKYVYIFLENNVMAGRAFRLSEMGGHGEAPKTQLSREKR